MAKISSNLFGILWLDADTQRCGSHLVIRGSKTLFLRTNFESDFSCLFIVPQNDHSHQTASDQSFYLAITRPSFKPIILSIFAYFLSDLQISSRNYSLNNPVRWIVFLFTKVNLTRVLRHNNVFNLVYEFFSYLKRVRDLNPQETSESVSRITKKTFAPVNTRKVIRKYQRKNGFLL